MYLSAGPGRSRQNILERERAMSRKKQRDQQIYIFEKIQDEEMALT
jgi:hypothetical protein